MNKILYFCLILLSFLFLENSSSVEIYDSHAHLLAQVREGRGVFISDYAGAIKTLINKMNELGIKKTIIMPHPFSFGQDNIYSLADYVDELKKHPDKIIYFGGGGTLNVMIHRYSGLKEINQKIKNDFEKKAKEIIEMGASGFGEMSSLHLSLRTNHPFQEVRPNHPLFLLLSDIAGENNMPVDIHMEAVVSKINTPEMIKSAANPSKLNANIDAFEELLDHNKNTKIIWDHLGWDNTGERTPELCTKLMRAHKNLYMNIKFDRDNKMSNAILELNKKRINEKWTPFLTEFSDRIMIGSDQFYYSPKSNDSSPDRLSFIRLFISLLPEDITKKILYDNPKKILNIN